MLLHGRLCRHLKCCRELGRRGEPVGRHLREGPSDRFLHGERDGIPERADPGHSLQLLSRRKRRLGPSREWGLAGEHLVQNAAQRIDVGTAVEAPRSSRLLRAHVNGRSGRKTCPRQPVSASLIHRVCDPEVGDYGMAARQHDIGGLDVPVNHSFAVRVVESVSDFPGQSESVVNRKLTLTADSVGKRVPLHVRHHVVEKAICFARVVQG